MARRREASIFVTMKNAGFLAGLRQLEKQVEKESRKMRRNVSVAFGRGSQEGLKRSREALKDIGSGIKETTKQAATFGGALGGAALIHTAMELQAAYAQIAFEMERATGKTYSVAQAQDRVSRASNETKRTHEEMATAMRIMLDRGADPKFAVASLELVGHTMNATGQDAERVGRLVGGLSNKFKLTGSAGAASMDQIIATATRAKVSTEEFMEDFNEFGSIAQAAGLKGEKGLQMMLAIIAKVGPKVNGSTSEISSGLDILFERMRDMGIVERIFKEGRSKVKFQKSDFQNLDGAVEQMEYLAKAGPQAMKLFAAEFTGREEKAAFDALFAPYFDTLNSELKSGKKETQAHLSGIESLRLNMNDMLKPIEIQSKVSDQSARLQVTSAARARDAMNKFNEAMTKPQMLDAIDSLSESLPPLASGIASALSFIAKNPALAAGAFGALKVGGSFAEGMVGTAGSKLGNAAGKAIMKSAAGQSAWSIAGKALGVAAGAAAAFYLGKQGIDAMFETRSKEHGGAVASEARAAGIAGSSSAEAKAQELERVRSQISRLKDEKSGIGGKLSNAANMTFGALAGGLGMTDGYTDSRADSLAKLEAAERTLRESLDKQRREQLRVADSGALVARAMRDVASAAGEASNALKGGGRGPIKPSHTGPGWSQ